MKSTKNILDYFNAQNTTLTCPGCGVSLPKSKLNIHLDSDCPSSVPSSKNIYTEPVMTSTSSITNPDKLENIFCKPGNNNTNLKTFPTVKIKSSKLGRLSLKHQKALLKKNSIVSKGEYVREAEVITLDDGDDDLSSSSDRKVMANDKLNEFKNQNLLEIHEENNLKSATTIDIEGNLVTLEPEENPKNSDLDQSETKKEKFSTTSKEEIKVESETKHMKSDITTSSIVADNSSSNNFSNVSNPKCSLITNSSVCNNNVELKSEINADILAVLNDAEESVQADNNVFNENSENEQTEQYSPYYIANFKHILKTVLEDEIYEVLFNEEDHMFIAAFESSSDAAQKLFVRLFQRKFNWLRLRKINYPKITNETEKFLNELVNVGLVDLGFDKIDLETAISLLSLSEARIIGKQYKLNISGKSKTDIAQLLLKHCKEHKSLFFCAGKNSMSNLMLKKLKEILGPCYRLSLLPKRLFTRILMLFSLPTMSEDDDDAAGGQQQQLLTLLQVNKGELTFPNYKINRQILIFTERDELIRYEEAKQLENDIVNAVEHKNFDVAKELYIEAREEFDNQLSSPFVERPASLPSFLKKYSSFHIYVRCMTQGVEILQKLRQYDDAVELLKRLLDQKVFCQDYRGRWWDRMALNLEQHLKQRQQALEAIQDAIKDLNVRVGYRYSLLTRALRILKNVDETDQLKNEILSEASVIEAPKVVIKGRLFPRNILGRKHIFISSSSTTTDEDDITVLGVEELAIEHYKNEGFTEGIHGESSTFHSLYGLLFWDIIYDADIPDAFISLYQTHPLDLNYDSFFIRREKQILNHLEALRASTIEELKNIVRSFWEAHFGQSSLVVWDRFTDVEHILGLVGCMGNTLLCGICERLARDYRFTRSGVPDLVVWNPETSQVKIVEVKGPGDKLSSKQILWLDYLIKLGADAEVCHVEAVGSKKLRKE